MCEVEEVRETLGARSISSSASWERVGVGEGALVAGGTSELEELVV